MVRVVAFLSMICTFIPPWLEEMPIKHWKRFRRWWGWKTLYVSEWWREQKETVSESFTQSRVSLWYDKGNTSVCDNVLQLNKVVRKSPPIYHKHPNLPEITLSALAETGHAEPTIRVLNNDPTLVINQ